MTKKTDQDDDDAAAQEAPQPVIRPRRGPSFRAGLDAEWPDVLIVQGPPPPDRVTRIELGGDGHVTVSHDG